MRPFSPLGPRGILIQPEDCLSISILHLRVRLMPLENDVLLKIEELKEVGHEYRYREQIMVQEFGLSMLVAGVLVGVIHANKDTLFALVAQCYGLGFLALLTLHLRNINQDRYAALAIKEKLRTDLGFQAIHQNTGGRKRRWISISSTRAIFLFSCATVLGWASWLMVSILAPKDFNHPASISNRDTTACSQFSGFKSKGYPQAVHRDILRF
jgi:hypothetical protein